MEKFNEHTLGFSVNPLCLNALQIAKVAAGQASPNADQHLEECVRCQAAMERYRVAHQVAQSEAVPAYLLEKTSNAWPFWMASFAGGVALVLAAVWMPSSPSGTVEVSNFVKGDAAVLMTLVRDGETIQENVPPEALQPKVGDHLRMRVIGAHTGYVIVRIRGDKTEETLYAGPLDEEHQVPEGLVYTQGTTTVSVVACDKAPDSKTEEAGCFHTRFAL